MPRSHTQSEKGYMTFARDEIKHIVENKNNRWPLGLARNAVNIFIPFFLPLFNASKQCWDQDVAHFFHHSVLCRYLTRPDGH